MKLIYTDTNGKGIIDVVHAYTCKDGQALLKKAEGQWNWQIFEAETREGAFDHLDRTEDLGGMYEEPELHYCPCVTIK